MYLYPLRLSKTIQCDLSDEENCELSKQLPSLLSYGDLLKPINEAGCTEEPEPRLSTVFSSPEEANTGNFFHLTLLLRVA